MSEAASAKTDYPINTAPLERPIRVVVFGGGPRLEPDVKQFLCRLEREPEIDFLGAFCQSASQTGAAVLRDLWRRRRLLAAPLLAARGLAALRRAVKQPAQSRAARRELGRLSDRIHFLPDIHDADALERVRALDADLGAIYGSPILKPQLFEIPRLGTLGIHHGRLPEYRGKKTTFWAVASGEPTAGVTIQRINAGLDTGDIVRAAEVAVGRRSLGRVRRDVQALGLDLYIEAILAVRAGTAMARATTGPRGKLYRDPSPRDILSFHWRRLTRRHADST